MNSSEIKTLFEDALHDTITAHCPESGQLKAMLRHHFGWDLPDNKPGKRLRPMFLLLTIDSAAGSAQNAMPAAVALEALHNYTLIHDDIEDNGDMRHGRVSLWKKYGLNLALNAGNYLNSMSVNILEQLEDRFPVATCRLARQIFNRASLDVIRGQDLDMLFEKQIQVQTSDYLNMIALKTGALFVASFGLGACLSQCLRTHLDELQNVGLSFGLGFQMLDDYLGIWGKQDATGKSNLSDIQTRKKTLPILYALQKAPATLPELLGNDDISAESAQNLAHRIRATGADTYTRELALEHMQRAITQLGQVFAQEGLDSTALEQIIQTTFEPILA